MVVKVKASTAYNAEKQKVVHLSAGEKQRKTTVASGSVCKQAQ